MVVLLGSFAIGAIAGDRGFALLKPFIVDSFAGFLCLFALDMGLVAGRGLREGWRSLSPSILVFAVVMPLIGGAAAAASTSSSASPLYISVAQRIAAWD